MNPTKELMGYSSVENECKNTMMRVPKSHNLKAMDTKLKVEQKVKTILSKVSHGRIPVGYTTYKDSISTTSAEVAATCRRVEARVRERQATQEYVTYKGGQ